MQKRLNIFYLIYVDTLQWIQSFESLESLESPPVHEKAGHVTAPAYRPSKLFHLRATQYN